jgi:hypothetical protein
MTREPARQPRRGRGRKLRLGLKRDQGGLITLSTAAAIFLNLTGRRKKLPELAAIMRERPHLAAFSYEAATGENRFIGVRRERWVYFLRARLALAGPGGLFHDSEI